MKSSSSLRRIGFSFGAQIYNQLANIGVQILLVPILLHGWGTGLYGVWLLLSAIPTYLTFTDFGFTLSAKSEMTIKEANGDSEGALATYQSVFMLLNGVAAIVIPLAGFVIFSVRLGAFFDLGDVSETEGKLTLFLLGLNIVLNQYFMLLSAGMRAAGRPATEIAIAATSRLFSGAIIGGTALLGGGILLAAVATLADSIFFIGVTFFWLRSISPWLRLGWAHASMAEAERLLHPSLSFMSQTLGYAFAIGGPVVILGMVATPVAVVIFSTCRTLARLGTTATNTIGASMLPEFSRIFGKGDFSQFKRLTLIHFLLALFIAFCFFASVSLLGSLLLWYWTKGRVQIEQPFFTLMLISVVGEMLWTTLYIPLCSINRHVLSANTYGLLALLALGVCYLAAAPFGLPGVVVPWIFVNFVMIAICAVQLWKQLPRSEGSTYKNYGEVAP